MTEDLEQRIRRLEDRNEIVELVVRYNRAVDDQATASFMQQFYRYLLIDRLSASAALRKAQLERARAGPSYEWAAFALYGWPDSSL